MASSRVHGRSSFGAFVDNKSSCTLNCGRKCLVLPSITYNELLGPVRGWSSVIVAYISRFVYSYLVLVLALGYLGVWEV